LLTGGDPLILSTGKLARVIEELRTIPHVRIIRIGSKIPAFNPYRILDDPELVELFKKNSLRDGRIYVVAQFNHPREVTDVAVEAVRLLQRNGVLFINQTPLLVGINDNPDTLAKLFTRLAQVGVPPYYIFQCRPTRGNQHFQLPLVKALDIVEAARKQVSGLAKRARFAGSHASGKIQILGYDNEWQYFKYHQAKNPDEYARFFKLPRNDEAAWWDDWMPNGESFTLSECPVVELGSGPA
jgi:KamA family protein